jgi:hypothetical protein
MRSPRVTGRGKGQPCISDETLTLVTVPVISYPIMSARAGLVKAATRKMMIM